MSILTVVLFPAPFGTLHRGRIPAELLTHLCLLRLGHGHRLAIHGYQRRGFVGHVRLSRKVLLPSDDHGEPEERTVDQADHREKR